jgi:hypothetical protein
MAEAKEGAGRNYEATCAAGIYRVMTICYEVRPHSEMRSRAISRGGVPPGVRRSCLGRLSLDSSGAFCTCVCPLYPQQARVPLEHVRYIEAHATGTRVGDIIGAYWAQ